MATRAKSNRPTYLLFVRHGMTPTTGKVLPGRAPGLHLSPAGRAEAGEVARRLGSLGSVRALYSSPIERAAETAEQISQVLGLPVEIEPGLNECDVGSWSGATLRTLRNRREWKVLVHHPSGFRFPGGESFIELQARMLSTVERLTTRHQGEVVVAVSHADPIKVALSGALGCPLDLCQRIVVGPCSTNVVAYGDGQPYVLAVNSFADPVLVGVPARRAKDARPGKGAPTAIADQPGSRGARGRARRTAKLSAR
jgi:probable phosphoglycerate mutase